MEYFLGLLTAVVFFVVYELGKRHGSKPQAKQSTVDEVKQRQMEQFNKDFQAVFNYDVSKALERKKVT